MHTKQQPMANCNKCGGQHKKAQCPAYGKKCMTCQRYNHFSKVCFYNKGKAIHVTELQNEESTSEFEYAGELKISAMNSENGWFALVKICDKTVKFKLDTGAEANIIPKSLYNKLNHASLRPTTTKLTTFSNATIMPIGKTTVNCQLLKENGKQQDLDFYVMNFNCTPLLGFKACQSFALVSKIESIDSQCTLEAVLCDYAHVFQGLGKFDGMYHIEIDSKVAPVINSPRNVPYTIMAKLKAKLNELVEEGILVPVQEATDWVNSLVVTEKKNGTLRLCIDPRNLNFAIKRHHFKIPTLKDVTSQLSGKKVFTILDEKDGYHQVQLDEESSYLCTFQTPFGRYRYTRLPFGLRSSSEIFQQKNAETFGDIDGVYMIADDMIIAAKDEKSHDEILYKVLKRAEQKNVKFNKDKIQFKVKSVKYMGNIISENGLRPDPDKIRAILDMPPPEDKAGVQRLLGTVNFLAQYIPNMSEITAPLRNLLRKNNHFIWEHEQQQSLQQIKAVLTKEPVLSFYDVTQEVTIQADASQNGIGACLLQNRHPIAYSSRALTQTEMRYAMIEKELLAIVFATSKFHDYIYGYL
jgi:hypothetical protein